MSRQLILKATLILFLSAGPSSACDPEEMINELRAQCRDAIASAVALIEPMKPALTAPDLNTLETKIKEATALCNSDKYSEGYTSHKASTIGSILSLRGMRAICVWPNRRRPSLLAKNFAERKWGIRE
jgi:hypothetical protein